MKSTRSTRSRPTTTPTGGIFSFALRVGGVEEELVRLTVHGTLHVLGYDHPEGRGRTRSAMWLRQERYVRRLRGGREGGAR